MKTVIVYYRDSGVGIRYENALKASLVPGIMLAVIEMPDKVILQNMADVDRIESIDNVIQTVPAGAKIIT